MLASCYHDIHKSYCSPSFDFLPVAMEYQITNDISIHEARTRRETQMEAKIFPSDVIDVDIFFMS